MSLQIGHKLAHYEILEPIGKGGMGEVYRAKDGKLGRNVRTTPKEPKASSGTAASHAGKPPKG